MDAETIFTLTFYHCFFIYNGHSVRVHRHSYPTRQFLYRLIFPVNHFFHIKCGSTIYRDTIFRGTLDAIKYLGRIE